MKRVERRGTLDSQQQLAGSHGMPQISTASSQSIHSPSASQNLLGNGRNNHSPHLSQGSDRSIHRTDTVIVEPHSRTAPNSSYLSTSSHRRDNSGNSGSGSRSRGMSPRTGPLSNSESVIGSHRNINPSRSSPTSAISHLLDNSSPYDDHDHLRYGGSDKLNGGQRSRRSTSSLSPPTPSASGTGVVTSRKASPRQSDSPRGHINGAHPSSSGIPLHQPNHASSLSTLTTYPTTIIPSSSVPPSHNNTTGGISAKGNGGKATPSDLLDADGDVDADADAEAEMDVDPDADGDGDGDADADLADIVDTAGLRNTRGTRERGRGGDGEGDGDDVGDVDAELLATVEGGIGDGASSPMSRSASRSRSGSGREGGGAGGGAGEREDEWLKKEDELI